MWTNELVLMFRHMINDVDEPLKYTDSRLEQLILVAAKQVKFEVGFSSYTVDVDAGTLSPDPTETATLDEAFSNLILLKAGCILDRGLARTGVNKSIKIASEGDIIDTTGAMTGHSLLLKEGYCKAYADTKFEYLAGGTGNSTPGEAILGPFRTEVFNRHFPRY